MSKDWVRDIHQMHETFGHHKAVSHFQPHMMEKLLDFRLRFLEEELEEMGDSIIERRAEDVVDAVIDLCVVAIGTLNLMGVDVHKAWDEVHRANMQKRSGENPTRDNGIGLPDLVKPEGWQAPNHQGNIGRLGECFE